jgi:hypothetical protein
VPFVDGLKDVESPSVELDSDVVEHPGDPRVAPIALEHLEETELEGLEDYGRRKHEESKHDYLKNGYGPKTIRKRVEVWPSGRGSRPDKDEDDREEQGGREQGG